MTSKSDRFTACVFHVQPTLYGVGREQDAPRVLDMLRAKPVNCDQSDLMLDMLLDM